MSVGSGGITACDVSLGADQFRLPQQKALMDTFFSNFYIYINLGGLFATIITPFLRNEGQGESFTLVFVVGVSTFLIASGTHFEE